MTDGKKGTRVYTLEGAGDAYRVLIESMNEGALMLTATQMVLYANQRLARMVQYPLEQVIGGSFSRFLSVSDRAALRRLLRQTDAAGSKIPVLLNAGDGSRLPGANLAYLPAGGEPGLDRATLGMVVTDMTEARRTEELLRALAQRGVQVQEAERERVALELHDNVTQQLCAVLFSSQALVDKLSAAAGPARKGAVKLRDMIGQTAGEVERISENLRSSVLDQLGLVAAPARRRPEPPSRTGVPVRAGSARPGAPSACPPATGLGLYRILQESLGKCAEARPAPGTSPSA